MSQITKKIRKILIANRGEIAVRIIATAKKMGIKTVAIYSEADTNSLHVREAHESIYIGPSPSSESYLNIERIIKAVKQSGADAVHPGYGFLSENSEFAERLEREGILFIGPSSKTIRQMGDKIESKKIASKAGVNTIPGNTKAVADADEAVKAAKKVGFPVMVKAAAGGGGKGMRIAHDEPQVREAFRIATNEAVASFRDGRVFIEKYIVSPRHIEIQILADSHGNVLYLGERECSIQRRNQKVIEEAPSSFLDEKTRQKMGKQSVALAKKVGYYSAGTVEFIVDNEKNFYFLEMNTRLQVEHRVTELVTDIDLVEQMIRIAEGDSLQLKQADIRINGWAFEARIYAEDPSRGFLPSTGRITHYEEPKAVNGVLLDSGIYEGGEVSMFYDPMIAKLCTYGADRAEALARMKEALVSYTIKGISHNISFMEAILANPRFAAGDISTKFIEEEYPQGFSGAELSSENMEIFLAVGLFAYLREAERDAQISGQLEPGNYHYLSSRWVITVAEESFSVNVLKVEPDGYDIELDNVKIAARSAWRLGGKLFKGTINNKPANVKIARLAEGYMLTADGTSAKVVIRTPRIAELAVHMPSANNDDTTPHLLAPIAGMLVKIKVREGEKVHPGSELVAIEAMKMENMIYATHEATIGKIYVKEGSSVNVNQKLMDFS